MSREEEKLAFARSSKILRSPQRQVASEIVVNENQDIHVHFLLAEGITKVKSNSGVEELDLQKLAKLIPPGKTTTLKRARSSAAYSHSGTPSPEQEEKRNRQKSPESTEENEEVDKASPETVAENMWSQKGRQSTGTLSQPQNFDLAATLREMEDRLSTLIQEEVVQCKMRLREVVTRLDWLETHEKEKNVIIFGFEEIRKKETERDDMEKEIEELTSKTGLPITDYDDAFRLGRFKPGSTRPILIKFVRMKDKKLFLKERNKLKGTAIKIENDQTHKQKLIRKTFAPIYQSFYQQDNSARRFIKGEEMIITKGGKQVARYALDDQGQPTQISN